MDKSTNLMSAVSELKEHTGESNAKAQEAALVKHTPGPWKMEPEHPYNPDKETLWRVRMAPPFARVIASGLSETEALLIAAAPETAHERDRLKNELSSVSAENARISRLHDEMLIRLGDAERKQFDAKAENSELRKELALASLAQSNLARTEQKLQHSEASRGELREAAKEFKAADDDRCTHPECGYCPRCKAYQAAYIRLEAALTRAEGGAGGGG